jgi:hypothetical protein
LQLAGDTTLGLELREAVLIHYAITPFISQDFAIHDVIKGSPTALLTTC